MKAGDTVEELFVIAVIGNLTCGIPIQYVHEMVPMPHVVSIPGGAKYIRGLINLRRRTIPLYDMRIRLGMPSCHEEALATVKMMDQREADHRRWLDELERSVNEKRPFTMATDPHQCAFGKWYYSYDFKSGANRCMALDMILTKFEGPHDRIHGIAEKVLAMEKAGNFDGAMALIEKTRKSELQKMIDLFGETRAVIREQRRELAMVVEVEGEKKALAVDAVESVDHLDFSESIEPPEAFGAQQDPVVADIAKRKKDSSLVVVLNLERIEFQAEPLSKAHVSSLSFAE